MCKTSGFIFRQSCVFQFNNSDLQIHVAYMLRSGYEADPPAAVQELNLPGPDRVDRSGPGPHKRFIRGLSRQDALIYSAHEQSADSDSLSVHVLDLGSMVS
jgi:hypothetical protein